MLNKHFFSSVKAFFVLLTLVAIILPYTVSALALTQQYYRYYVDNNALIPTDPYPSGSTDLAENQALTSAYYPLAPGEHVRLRMALHADAASVGQAFKLQYGTLSSTCGSISSWHDLGDPSSGETWRGYNATPADGTALSTDPPTGGDLKISVSDRAGTYEEQNNSATQPYTANINEDLEYDWNIEYHNANPETTYCFRMVSSLDIVFDTYADYPKITTAGFRPESKNWRWYDDETHETPVTPLAAENTAPINLSNGSIQKLRLTLSDTANVSGTNVKFKMQFSEDSTFVTGTEDVRSTEMCDSGAIWCYGDGTDTDNDAVSALVLSDSASLGTHNERPTSTTTFDPNGGSPTEYEFTLKLKKGMTAKTYYFRAYDVTNDLAVPLFSGESYPSISTYGPELTVTVSGLTSGTTTEGVTTNVTTLSNTIPFSSLTVGSIAIAAQRITISTNADSGYLIYLAQDGPLQHTRYGPSVVMAPVGGSNSSPAAYAPTGGATSAYGYHAGDDALGGGSTRFASNDTYAALTTSLSEIAYSSGPVSNESTDIIYKLSILATQPAGTYSHELYYVITPIF